MQTITNQPVQTEVSLRTLASDIQSIEHGAGAPTPSSFKVDQQLPETDAETDSQPHSRRSLGHTLLLIAILLAMAVGGYFYIYPLLMGALTTPASVH